MGAADFPDFLSLRKDKKSFFVKNIAFIESLISKKPNLALAIIRSSLEEELENMHGNENIVSDKRSVPFWMLEEAFFSSSRNYNFHKQNQILHIFSVFGIDVFSIKENSLVPEKWEYVLREKEKGHCLFYEKEIIVLEADGVAFVLLLVFGKVNLFMRLEDVDFITKSPFVV